MKLRIFTYLITAWLLAPLVAAAAGWRGVWGTGSAALDYLLPLPISGGALHVPSWLLGAGLVALRQRADTRAPWWAGLGAATMAGAGGLLLVDMADLALWWQAGAPRPSVQDLWSAHPLGLFLLVDGLLARVWPHAAGVPVPRPRRAAGALLAAGALGVLGASQWQQTPVSRHDLLPVQSRPGPDRGDEVLAYYTTLPMTPATLADAVARLGQLPAPQDDVNVQDQAVLFFDEHEAARQLRPDRVRMTWCRYDDGTPARWIEGAGDCFSGHLNFSERLAGAHDRVDPRLSLPVRLLLARVLLCRTAVGAAECASVDSERAALLARPDLTALEREALAPVR